MKIPIARTQLTEKEFEIIRKPLESGWVVQGPFTKEFEEKWSDFTGAKHSIAVTSCTTALHLSLAALGLKADDEVIVPAFTWIATANVVEHLKAKVVFCDIDLVTFNIDVNQIEDKITSKTKAIIPVHLFGLSADMAPIMEIAKKLVLLIKNTKNLKKHIIYVKDRNYNDKRYNISFRKLSDLGWKQKFNLEKGLINTILYYNNIEYKK